MKILYISTIIDTIETFLTPHIRMLVKSGYSVDIAGFFTKQPSKELIAITKRQYNIPLQRNPLDRKNIAALKALIKIIRSNKYDLIDVHTPVASVIGRIAAVITKTKVIYTAHGFHFYKGAPFLNWLVYFPIEWLFSWFTDTLITINIEDYEFAKKNLNARDTKLINGVGIKKEHYEVDTSVFDSYKKRLELGLKSTDFVLIYVGELNENKNQAVIIKALAKICDESIHFLVVGVGENKSKLIELTKSLKLEKQVHFLGFREDVAELYHISNVNIFTSIREGLGLAALEGMAVGLPLICSDNRGTRCYATNNVNSIVCDAYDIDNFKKAILKYQNDVEFYKNCSLEAKRTTEKYKLEFAEKQMLNIHLSFCY